MVKYKESKIPYYKDSIIYAPSIYGRYYWHEYSHYIDSQNKYYKMFRFFISGYMEAMSIVVFLLLIYELIFFKNIYSSIYLSFFSFIPYMIISFLEEFKADIYSYFNKNIKRYSAVHKKAGIRCQFLFKSMKEAKKFNPDFKRWRYEI